MSEVGKLNKIANTIRQDVIKMVAHANSGHIGGALGLADIFAVLYFHVLNHKPKKPDWKNRDKLLLSNGHTCAVRYSAMARSGYFPVSELKTFRKLGSRLQGHPSLHDLPGVESSSGSLGQGLSIAVGMAIAAKINNEDHRIFCVTSDGDLNEGSSWEAINAAHKWELNNLIAIVDRNYIQISGNSEDVWPLESLKKKFEAHHWQVIETDGNDIKRLLGVFERIKKNKSKKPIVVIARTILGKGVSFMENNYAWHGKPPSVEEAKQAISELENG